MHGEPRHAAARPDRELLRGVVAREASALGELYDRHSPRVLAVAMRILRERSDAEEILGDVFWILWERPERYDPSRANLLTYLVTLTRSRAIDRLRARKRGPVTGVDEAERAEPAPEAGQVAQPLASALRGEQRERIRQALAGLQPDQRKAIELAFYDGLSHSEISTELAEPLGTVKSRIRLGLIRLRDSLRIVHGSGETA